MTATRPLAIRNAHLIDPASGFDATADLLVRDGRIEVFGPRALQSGVPADAEIVDAKGLTLSPGLIDLRVFTGEPGGEHRETLETASLAAAAGGVTTFVAMPNTDPVIDDLALVDFIARRARDRAHVNVLAAAALTRGLKGEGMTEYGLLKEAGAVMVTDGNRSVASTLVMRRCLSYAASHGILVAAHAEDVWLAANGAANESAYAARLGLAGIPAVAETIIVERDLRLVALTGARYHLGQVSTVEALEAVRAAKAKGLRVSCAVSAHHLALNEADVEHYKTFAKVSPPLRSEDDRRAMVEGLRDGVIDAIVSSHDPQAAETKRLPFAQAAYGAIGLETLLPAALTCLHGAQVPLLTIIRALTIGPAQLLDLPQGSIARGAPADLVLFDANTPVRVDPAAFHSLTRNTPFKGRLLQGRVEKTIVAGRIVFSR